MPRDAQWGGVLCPHRTLKECGGPGSGKPGPCPQNKPHIKVAAQARSKASVAAKEVAKAEAAHAKKPTPESQKRVAAAKATAHAADKEAVKHERAAAKTEAATAKKKNGGVLSKVGVTPKLAKPAAKQSPIADSPKSAKKRQQQPTTGLPDDFSLAPKSKPAKATKPPAEQPSTARPIADDSAKPAKAKRPPGTKADKRAESPEFKNWFGDSQAAYDDGSPIPVYHGTRAGEIDQFRAGKGGAAGSGIYFSENPEIGNTFASGGGGSVHKSYVSIRKPLDFNSDPPKGAVEEWTKAVSQASPVAAKLFKENLPPNPTNGQIWAAARAAVGSHRVNDIAQSLGYDGLVHATSDVAGQPNLGREPSKFGRVWVAFKPNQVKSTSNRGTFDPNSDKINEAELEECGGPSATVDECTDDSDPIKIDLPDVRQDENYTCGAACVQSLCQHYGVGPDREEDYAKALGSDPDAGTDHRRIVAYLKERGLSAVPKAGMTVDELRQHLDQHHPVIVAFQAWGEAADYTRDDNGHYAIAMGHDATNLYLEDPSLEGSRGAIPWAEFEQRWHDEEADGTKLVRFGIVVSQVQPRPIEAVESVSPDKVALGGRDGETVEKLIERTIKTGTRAVADLIERATTRLLQRGQVIATSRLFDDNERQELAAVIAATRATANLLGRALVRDWLERSISESRGDNKGDNNNVPTLATLLEEIGVPAKPVQPRKALSYFQRLVPKLGTDPERFAPDMERQAFTLAVATEEQMLYRVMDVINERIASGAGVSSAPQDIKAIMDQAGVSYRNPQMPEAIFRTNAMDAYNAGLQQEVNDPEVVENFPVWEYHAIIDSRSRPEHAARNGLYYPNSAKFAQVRGVDAADAINCRCTFSPVYIEDWKQLRKSGARVADGYPEPVV